MCSFLVFEIKHFNRGNRYSGNGSLSGYFIVIVPSPYLSPSTFVLFLQWRMPFNGVLRKNGQTIGRIAIGIVSRSSMFLNHRPSGPISLANRTLGHSHAPPPPAWPSPFWNSFASYFPSPYPAAWFGFYMSLDARNCQEIFFMFGRVLQTIHSPVQGDCNECAAVCSCFSALLFFSFRCCCPIFLGPPCRRAILLSTTINVVFQLHCTWCSCSPPPSPSPPLPPFTLPPAVAHIAFISHCLAGSSLEQRPTEVKIDALGRSPRPCPCLPVRRQCQFCICDCVHVLSDIGALVPFPPPPPPPIHTWWDGLALGLGSSGLRWIQNETRSISNASYFQFHFHSIIIWDFGFSSLKCTGTGMGQCEWMAALDMDVR